MRFRPLILLLLALGAALLGGCASASVVELRPEGRSGPRVLAVVAHPDDEIAFAGTVFKTATHLGGTVDLVVITNGEAGYKYSTLAEALYRRRLTDPVVGRIDLPTIRRQELIEGCTILGFRSVHFLDQTDTRYALDPEEVIGPDGAWDVPFVARTLDAKLARGDYDFVLTHFPTPGTHGHHKAATIQALEAVQRMAPEDRPVVVGSHFAPADEEREPPPMNLEGYPVTQRLDEEPVRFDRSQKFGYRDRLDYRIVVNWAIAAHKSQGTMQMLANREGDETYYRYAVGPEAVAGRRALDGWFAALAEPQFETLEYDEQGALLERSRP